MECPWCNVWCSARLNDGGSAVCNTCSRTFHECADTNPNGQVAPNGRLYAVGSVGPASCPHCLPVRQRQRREAACPGWG